MDNSLNSTPTPIVGAFVLERQHRGDERGFFERIYCSDSLASCGWQGGIAQVNHSFTAERGTCRGLHYQLPPFDEYKLVSCLRGAVWDVVLDLRHGSPSFLHYFSIELSEQNARALLLPPGCAHGFQTLSESVDLLYCHSQRYAPDCEAGVHVLDPRLNIAWPLPVERLSPRDAAFAYVSDDFQGVQIEMPPLPR